MEFKIWTNADGSRMYVEDVNSGNTTYVPIPQDTPEVGDKEIYDLMHEALEAHADEFAMF